MFQRRPGNRKPVIGGGAAADFIEDDEGPVAGPVQDGGGLDHLDHEGRPAARQIVGGADATEHPVDDPDHRPVGGNEHAGLRHDGDMRVLAEEGRFAGHVRSGDKPEIAGIAKPAVIRNEALAGAEHRFDHRMAPAFDVEAAVVADVGAAMALPCGKRRRGHGDVERRQRPCRRRQLFGLRKRGLAKPVENLELPCQRAVGRGRQVAFQIGQLGGGETHRLRRRLAVDETVVLHQLFGMRVADIDMVAEDIVVLHLQRRDAGRLDILLLQRGDQSPAFIAERAQLVERRVEPGPNEAAVARQKRQLVGKRRRKLGGKRHRRHDHVVKRRQLGKARRAPARVSRCRQVPPPSTAPSTAPAGRAGRHGPSTGATAHGRCRAAPSSCREARRTDRDGRGTSQPARAAA